MIISCLRAGELISKSMDQRLSLGEALALRLHLMICGFCSQYRAQLRLVHLALSRMGCAPLEDAELAPIPAGVKARVKERVLRQAYSL
jgi:hypothetical protein